MKILTKMAAIGIATVTGSYLLSGVTLQNDFYTILIVAVILGLLNAIVRPILVFLTIPITVVTLGVFLLVINASMILLTANLVDGFTVDSFLWALALSLILSFVNMLFKRSDKNKNRIKKQIT